MMTTINLEQAATLLIEQIKPIINQLIENRGHNKPPFLSKEFARFKGIKKIIESDLGDIGAVLLKFDDGYVIKVNEKHPSTRQNFSCAHEIGHLFVNELELESCLQDVEFRTFNPQGQRIARFNAKERLCDIAATELLMPESIFKRYLSEFGISAFSIERLANIFRTSIQATSFRIAEVSPEPCIALIWQNQKTNKSKGLRLSNLVGPGRNLSGKSSYDPINKIAPIDSSLYTAFQSNNIIKSHRLFKIGNSTKRLLMESKGFGYDERRYVVSLALIDK